MARANKADKLQDHMSYPPRAMRAERAAAYLGGMAPSTFFELVEDGLLPRGVEVKGMKMWDRHDLDAAFDELKARSRAKRRNPFEEAFAPAGGEDGLPDKHR
jgi:predicted DNA-binding transcriptional regulator AlpA